MVCRSWLRAGVRAGGGDGMSGDGAVEFGLVAALEREISGAVRGWSRGELRVGERECRVYVSAGQRAALVCAGTGRERAYETARALMGKFAPRVLVSVGFAGSCVPELRPGALVTASKVVEAETEREFRCATLGEPGEAVVVSLGQVAGRTMKQTLRTRFGAAAVEMEAAGVAQAAAGRGTEFAAIKAISDGAEEEMEFLSGFVTPEGFATGRFLAHVAMRPGLWTRVAALQRNSGLAASALEKALGGIVECRAAALRE
jgi:adenosylhomocysteine nucleosidase